MNYLFALWEGGGNVPPALSLVRKLVARGHAVTVLGDITMAGEARATGARFRAWERAPSRTSRRREQDLVNDYDIKNPARLIALLREKLVMGPAEAYAADVDLALNERPFDAVVSEYLLFGALVAAEARGVPRIALVPNVYVLPVPGVPPFGTGFLPATGPLSRLRDRIVTGISLMLWNRGLPALNRLRQARGLAPLGAFWDQVGCASKVLVLTSAAFDFKGAYPEKVRHVGAELSDPDWVSPWEPPAQTAPLVLVGLSTMFMNQEATLQRIIDALGCLPTNSIFTTGPAIDPERFSHGDRVQLVRSAPHGCVLRHAALCITHGGHGTLLKALSFGVPVLCLPMGRDQHDNGARLVASGAGLRLDARASAARIEAAARRLLSEPAFTVAAQRLAAIMAEEERAGAAIVELENLSRSSSRSFERINHS
ncbi:glycosyltransferase [Pendulispora albinea]|uniref:Glycosyltransferase n=1 Tax=Pendulispora albinea TaxID=2741071 RepID=A0ABZ2LT90_9BACT